MMPSLDAEVWRLHPRRLGGAYVRGGVVLLSHWDGRSTAESSQLLHTRSPVSCNLPSFGEWHFPSDPRAVKPPISLGGNPQMSWCEGQNQCCHRKRLLRSPGLIPWSPPLRVLSHCLAVMRQAPDLGPCCRSFGDFAQTQRTLQGRLSFPISYGRTSLRVDPPQPLGKPTFYGIRIHSDLRLAPEWTGHPWHLSTRDLRMSSWNSVKLTNRTHESSIFPWRIVASPSGHVLWTYAHNTQSQKSFQKLLAIGRPSSYTLNGKEKEKKSWDFAHFVMSREDARLWSSGCQSFPGPSVWTTRYSGLCSGLLWLKTKMNPRISTRESYKVSTSRISLVRFLIINVNLQVEAVNFVIFLCTVNLVPHGVGNSFPFLEYLESHENDQPDLQYTSLMTFDAMPFSAMFVSCRCAWNFIMHTLRPDILVCKR